MAECEYAVDRDPEWAAPLLARSEFRNLLALAKQLGTRLATSDREILAAFPETAASPEAFVSH